MNKDMDGKLISRCSLPYENSTLISDDMVGLYFSATYHGDRDEFWIVVTDDSGNETARWNARYVEYIKWEEPIEPKP